MTLFSLKTQTDFNMASAVPFDSVYPVLKHECTKLREIVKTSWIAALLSGDYAQTQNLLRTDTNKYCCLGVAAMIMDEKFNEDTKNNCYFVGENINCVGELPEKIWNSYFYKDKKLESLPQSVLYAFNDILELNFEEIAEWIRKNL